LQKDRSQEAGVKDSRILGFKWKNRRQDSEVRRQKPEESTLRILDCGMRIEKGTAEAQRKPNEDK
jgi:hypothetical protein